MARARRGPGQTDKKGGRDTTTPRTEQLRPTLERQGPRPLPLHLATAALLWGSSLSAWTLWKSDSLRWSASLQAAKPAQEEASEQALRATLEKCDPEIFQTALAHAVRERMGRFLDGVEAYRSYPEHRDLPDMPVIWQEGNNRLLDYAPDAPSDAPTVLFVPSLVNRFYVLDLDRETSLLRWLAHEGFKPVVMDWGAPGESEKDFALTDYVAGRLEAALDALKQMQEGPLHLAGYCMGGLLALALAQRRSRDFASLVLMAAPWDFHAEQPDAARLLGLQADVMAPLLGTMGVMPTDMIQSYFALLDPAGVLKKFLAFARFEPGSPKARRFVALEDWLNDGVPLAAKVAGECLSGWYGRNEPARGHWRIAGHPVKPEDLRLPALVMVPAQDRIVPPRSALALAAALPGAQVEQPNLGHIGMVVSARAPERIWKPLAEWLSARS